MRFMFQVHILTHHPSNKQMMPAWSREYSKILSRYENLIRGVFVGHTHSDSPLVNMRRQVVTDYSIYTLLQILRNFDNISTVVTYINPSFTSRNGKMSEFRILTLGKMHGNLQKLGRYQSNNALRWWI